MAIVDELIALLGYRIEGEEDLKRFTKSLDGLEKKFHAVGAAIGNFAELAAVAVAGGLSVLGKSVISTSAEFEKYEATLTTIEGSADKAKKALGWVTDFARTTPYEVNEVTQAFVKLKSYGLDPMDGTLSTIGDTASGMNKSLDQAVEAFADAMTGEFERLKEFGIRASQKGEQVTFTWVEGGKEMTKTVKKSSKDILRFLNDTLGKKFDGAMVRQSKTWSGMLSNLGDAWTSFKRRIGDAGFFDAVKNKLADLLDVIDRWSTDGTLQKTADRLSAIFTGLVNSIGVFAERVARHIGFISANFEKLEPYIKGVAVALGLLTAARHPVIAALMAIGLIIDDFLTYLEGGESVLGKFIDWLRGIIPVSKEVADVIATLGTAVTAGLIAAFAIAPGTMTGIVARLVASLVGLLGPALIAGLTGLSTVIVSGFTAAFALLSNPVGWAVILAGVAAALVAYFWNDLKALWDGLDFASLGRKIGEGIIQGLQSMAGAVQAAVQAMIPKEIRAPGFSMGLSTQNLQSNAAKIGNSAGGVIGDAAGARSNTNNINVNAPVTVKVDQATQAPGAVGKAISTGISKGVQAQPSRMQSGPQE